MNKQFTKERFLNMCDMAEVVEDLVATWMNAKTLANDCGTFQIVDKETQKSGIPYGWHIPDLLRSADGKRVEVKEDFSSARTGNIAIEKNCLDRMMKYCEDNNFEPPLLASVNHKEYSILFYKCDGLQKKLDNLYKAGRIRLLRGGDLGEWNYIIPLNIAKEICDFYDGIDFPSLAKPILQGRSVPSY